MGGGTFHTLTITGPEINSIQSPDFRVYRDEATAFEVIALGDLERLKATIDEWIDETLGKFLSDLVEARIHHTAYVERIAELQAETMDARAR